MDGSEELTPSPIVMAEAKTWCHRTNVTNNSGPRPRSPVSSKTGVGSRASRRNVVHRTGARNQGAGPAHVTHQRQSQPAPPDFTLGRKAITTSDNASRRVNNYHRGMPTGQAALQALHQARSGRRDASG